MPLPSPSRKCLSCMWNILPAVLLSVSLLCAAPQQTASDPSKNKDPLNRETPQSTVVAFLEAYRAHDYTRAAKYLDRRKLPAAERLKGGPGLARELGEILNRDAQFDVADLSREPEGDRERVDTYRWPTAGHRPGARHPALEAFHLGVFAR